MKNSVSRNEKSKSRGTVAPGFPRISQVMSGRGHRLSMLIVSFLFTLNCIQAQVAVTVTGNTNTTPNLAASYTSLASALTDLNAVTAMSGPVTLTLAAGGSETAPVKGFVVGSATLNPVLSATNTVTIVKASGAATVINAGVGTATPASASPDGMLYLNGADYVTIDGITFTDGNAASATVAMEFGVALFKRSAGDGCNNNTIQNCIFNMQRINNTAGTAPMGDGSIAIVVVNSTAAAATTALVPTNGGTLATNGTNSNNKIYNNQINSGNSGIYLSGYAATSGVGPSPAPSTFLGDINNDIGGTASSTGNSILNFGGGASTNPAFGIRANNQWSVNIRYNTIDNNNGSGVNHATTLRGIYSQAGTSANATISNNSVTVRSGATTSALTAIDNGIGSTAASNAVDISNNTIRFSYTTATSGLFAGISNTATAASVTINGNNIQQLSSTNYPSTGTVAVIAGGSPGGTLSMSNNIISNFSMTGLSGTLRAITSSTPTGLSTITGNTIENLSYTAATSTGSITGIYNLASATTQNVNSNVIRNFSTPTTGTLNGIQNNTVAGTFQCQNNQIYNFTTTAGGAGGFSANGITWSNATVTLSGNIIYAINSSGTSGGTGGSINGITVSGAATISGNAVYNLSSNSTNVTIVGISIGASGTNNVNNNLVGDLRAPNSTGNISISGILVSAGTTNNIFHNTVNIASTTSSATTFGTSAIYFSSTSPVNNLRNNVFVNTSAPGPTGGFTAAIRYTAAPTTTNFPATNNNNFYYAGTPAANRLIYGEGSAATATNGQQTIANYKTYISVTLPAPGRESASVSEAPDWVSTNGSNPITDFLKYNTGTASQIEQGGGTGTGITADYAGTARCPGTGCPGGVSTPDMGAWELNGIAADLTAPVISYTVLPNSLCTNGPTLIATITDVSGVNVTSGTSPRLYYKKSTDANTVAGNTSADNGWKFVETSSTSSPFSFTLNAGLLQSPIMAGDNIQYFVVAQDIVTIPNVGVNTATFTSAPSSVALTSASFPVSGTNSYNVLSPLATSLTIGTGGDYPTLTGTGGLFAAINAAGLSGNTTVTILDASVTETGTVALNQIAYGCSGSATLTIKPQTTATLTGSVASGALIKLNGADNVIIDGSNNGGADRSLTITNTATTAATAVWLSSTGTGAGATNNTIKNCVINASAATSATAYGISVSGATIGSAGADNDNVTIQNNLITSRNIGVYANGSTTTSAGGLDNLIISGNTFNSVSASTLTTLIGIQLGNALGSVVSGNNLSLSYAGSGTPVGISLETGVSGTQVTRNNITQIATTSTGGYGGRGITVGTGSATSNITIANNNISGVNGSNYSSFGNSSSVGIAIGVLGNSSTLSTVTGGINLYHNTVNLYGSYSYSASCLTTALYVGSGATSLDIRNNIFVNSLNNTNGSGTTSKNYSIYSAAPNTAFSNINHNDYFVSGSQGVLAFLASDQSTLSALATAFGGNANSISADPVFNSNSNLQPQPGSPVLAAGVAGTGITTDYTGATRGTPPSIGSYEAGLDGIPPVITYVPLPNTICTNSPVLSATLTDVSGINITPGTSPRLYYRKSTDANTFAGNTSADNGWKFVETTSSSSPYSFTINAGLLQAPIASGDIIQYFVIAQDAAPVPNVSANTATFTAAPASVALTSAAFPVSGVNSYSVLAPIATNVTVGTGGDYPTLTGAGGLFATINAGGLADNATVTLIGSSITETGANALNQIAYGCSGPVTLTIKPQNTVTLTGSVSSGALIKLNGADNVIIDGSNSGGTDRSLTITNTATTAPTAIWMASTGTGAGATNNIIKNCIINASAATSSTAYGISVSGASTSATGADNDNITIQNNLITSTNVGVYANGSAAVSAGGIDNLNITGNTFNSVSSSSLATLIGIQIGNALGTVVSQNTLSLSYAASGQPVGISLETGVSGARVTRNNITQVTTTSTGGYGGRGITVGTGSVSSDITISNNNIAGVSGSNYSSFGNSSAMGIAIGVIGNSTTVTTVAGGVNLYHNSVNMYGDYSYAASCITAALYVGSSASALDIRNNIFVNSMNNTNASGTTSKNYALYSASANTAFANINFNNYYVSGLQGVLGFLSSDRTTIAAVRTATAQDVKSLSTAPSFVSSTNLHLNVAGNDCLDKSGTPVAAVTNDFDGDNRSATTPDIGMDEFTSSTDFSIQVSESSGSMSNDGKVCAGASAVLTAANGTSYLWSSGESTASATVSPATTTTYTVTITLSGCSVTSTYTVEATALPTLSTAYTETSGITNNDGTICVGSDATITASGASTYSWSTGGTNASVTVTPSATTTYTVTATDSNNCTATTSAAVTVNALPSPSIAVSENSGNSPDDGIICTGASATLAASSSNSYSWSTGASTSSINVSPSSGASYTVTVSDQNNCYSSVSSAITVNSLPTPSVSVTENSGVINDGIILTGSSASLTASGGSSYLWNTGVTTATLTVSPTATTTYTVTVTNTNGCTATGSGTITVVQEQLPIITISETSGNSNNDGITCTGASVTLSATNGASYVWSTGSSTSSTVVAPTTTTTYTVTATDSFGITSTASTTVTVNALPTPSVSVAETSGISGNDAIICIGASATLTATGGVNFLWNTGGTMAALTVSPSTTTTYTVTVTNSDGCSATTTKAITVNPLPVPSVSASETSGILNNDGVICIGASVSLTASGGTSYVWSTGASTTAVSVSPTATTTYTVTATNANGCMATATRTVTVNPLPTPSISATETSGNEQNDGTICIGASATLTASGGTSYVWNTGGTTAAVTVSPTTNTTYTVTVTNANGCVATTTRTVTVFSLPVPSVSVSETSGSMNNDGVICAGASAMLTASGGTSYLWSNGGTTATVSVSPSSSSTYTVTVTNSNGCTATSTKSITVIPAPAPVVSVTETSGIANNDGSVCIGSGATLTASGGVSYAWNNGSASASITVSPNTTTTYTVTVTNANGCSTATSTTIIVNPLPTAGITVTETSGVQSNDGAVCAGSSATLTATGGTNYLWSNGSTTAAVTVTPSSTTTYSVTVTSAAGCSAVATVTVTINSLPVPVLLTSDASGLTNDDGVICSGANATLAISGGSSYQWSNGSSGSSVTVSPASTTTYTVTVTNADACIATATKTVVVNALPVPSFSYAETSGLTNNDGVICTGASAMITATGGTSYAWNTGGATSTITVSPVTTTTYTVTVTNSNGCTVVSNSSVTVNALPTASIAVVDTSGAADNDGIILIGDSATLTASGGVSYAWSTGANTAAITVTPPTTTTYTVTVTNNNGCTSTVNTTITASLQQMAVITVTETSGSNSNDGIICVGGSATLSVAGGTSYLWSNGSTAATIVVSPSVTSTYTVTDTDSRGTTTTTSVTIVVNSLPTPSVSAIETSGIANNDGIICTGASVTLTASGGNTYSWSNGGISPSFTVVPSTTTTYTVTVTNANGCAASASVTVNVNPLPTPSVSVTETSGVANDDGITCSGASATLTATGGSLYTWSNGGTAAAITVAPVTTTTYTVTVTNANGCVATATKTISVTPLPTPLVSVAETSGVANNDAIVCLGESATLTANGGTMYLWNGGGTSASLTVTPVSTTTYTVTATNANGCSATATSTVTVNPLPTPVIGVTETSGLTSNDGIICIGASTSLTASGGTQYSWSNGSATAAITVSPSVTTTYTVTVTNANGCSATATRTITVNTLPVASVTVSETSGAMNNDGNICLGSSALLMATGGSSYVWSNGATTANASVSPMTSTTYTVTVSNANGCTATSSTTVTVSFPPSITAVSTVCAPASTVLTITGDFFTGASQVAMNGTNCPNYTVISATQINVSKPFDGPVQSISVTNTCGTTTYQANVSVTSFSPASGQPGTIVNISGVNMACLQSVTMGGVPQIILSNSDNAASVFLMPGSVTGPITVTSTNNSSASSSSSFTVTATPNPYVQQGAKQVGTAAIGNAQQGTSVAVSADGNTAVVGGPLDDSNKGAAWIFVRNGTSWSQQGGKLVGTGAIGAAKQGTSVAISADGNTVAVGGSMDNSSAGAVWVFTRSNGTWSQQGGKLVGTGATGLAQQGSALSMSADGNVLAVGGVGDDMLGGATWIFARNNNTWSQEGAKLVGTNMVGKARQGAAVAISSDGNTLIVGGNNDMTRRGASWIFTRNGGATWNQQGNKLVGTGGVGDNYQGFAVAISADGNTVLIGANADNSLVGAVWVFTRSGGTWTQLGNKIVGTGATGASRQGSSVGLSADGNTAVIGGFGDNSNRGAMWVFKRNGSTWTQQGAKVTGSGATGIARQCAAISLSANGTTAAVGGPADATNKGAFWIFVPNTSFADTKTDVRTEEEQAQVTPEWALYQNSPNPLSDRTTVGFTIPEACTAEWQIADMSGRIILALKRDYPAGDNTEVFDMNGYQGVYWYTLKTPFGTKTRKMVVVK